MEVLLFVIVFVSVFMGAAGRSFYWYLKRRKIKEETFIQAFPMVGSYVDDDGEDQTEKWFFLPGLEVKLESLEGPTVGPRHDF